MAVAGLFKYAQRAFFSKPSPQRQLLKLVKGSPIRRVVEIGVDSVDATEQLLAALVKQAGGEPISYAAIDPFDERADGRPAPLMQVYQRLVATGARVRLIPGDPDRGVTAEANSLGDTDLLLFASTASGSAMQRGWYYIPRMCHPGTQVLFRQTGDPAAEDPGSWEAVELAEIQARAQSARSAQAA